MLQITHRHVSFFKDPYAIVVDRDPRIIYVFGKTRLLTKNHFMPTEDVKAFVDYFRSIREGQPYKEPNERILILQFEDFVYNYDESTKALRDFLKLPENPRPRTIFDPALSKANTQVFKRFPQYAEDIKYIEEQLSIICLISLGMKHQIQIVKCSMASHRYINKTN